MFIHWPVESPASIWQFVPMPMCSHDIGSRSRKKHRLLIKSGTCGRTNPLCLHPSCFDRFNNVLDLECFWSKYSSYAIHGEETICAYWIQAVIYPFSLGLHHWHWVNRMMIWSSQRQLSNPGCYSRHNFTGISIWLQGPILTTLIKFHPRAVEWHLWWMVWNY